jgi:membrane-associated protein
MTSSFFYAIMNHMFDVVSIVKTAGYLGVTAIIFAESGLLFGFFLPGDSLLFTAGVLAAAGFLNIWILVPLVFLAAVLGDNAGYFLGRRAGGKLFDREESFFFKRSNVDKAKKFFEKHGRRSIILARFVPVVRAFVPPIAGVGQMSYRRFLLADIIGGALWACGLPILGYFLGKTVSDIDKYLLPIIGAIIFLSVLPVLKLWFAGLAKNNVGKKEVVRILKTGGIGVLPTDTIYGLVGCALSEESVARIYQVRKRSPEKPLIVLISGIKDIQLFGISEESPEVKIARRSWPGKVSIILPCDNPKFEYLHRGTKTLAFRLPDKRELLEILEETGPLVAPSANHEGKQPALTIKEARAYFENEVDFYEDGGIIPSEPSTILKITGEEIIIIREGSVKI